MRQKSTREALAFYFAIIGYA